jgi:hypothetical protein
MGGRKNKREKKKKKKKKKIMGYPATFFACFRTFAHRLFAALTIAALPPVDKTRFFTPTTSRSAEPPNAFAAARTPLSLCCTLSNCFSSFLSSRLIAARMFMNPPHEIYLNREVKRQTYRQR